MVPVSLAQVGSHWTRGFPRPLRSPCAPTWSPMKRWISGCVHRQHSVHFFTEWTNKCFPLVMYIKWSQLLRSLKCEERLRKWKGSIPGSGSSPGERNGSLLQYSCLGNPMDRKAWRATIYEIMESDMTEQLSTHARRGDGCISLWVCQMSLNCSL